MGEEAAMADTIAAGSPLVETRYQSTGAAAGAPAAGALRSRPVPRAKPSTPRCGYAMAPSTGTYLRTRPECSAITSSSAPALAPLAEKIREVAG